MRKKLLARRSGYNQKVTIVDVSGGEDQTIYIRTGEYEDGSLGEIFVDVDKKGTMIQSFCACFSIMVSIALQSGVPLEELVEKFVGTNFPPNGSVKGHEFIKRTSSIIDLIFKDLAINYLQREDLKNVGRSDQDTGTEES